MRIPRVIKPTKLLAPVFQDTDNKNMDDLSGFICPIYDKNHWTLLVLDQ